jgi:hypothetical protein
MKSVDGSTGRRTLAFHRLGTMLRAGGRASVSTRVATFAMQLLAEYHAADSAVTAAGARAVEPRPATAATR